MGIGIARCDEAVDEGGVDIAFDGLSARIGTGLGPVMVFHGDDEDGTDRGRGIGQRYGGAGRGKQDCDAERG